ncbi:hypothetical protein LBMAG42_43330 [Deltaproteobacteria bacterium]|nr:hypothetical protein LBMAG42_43330 [Deltaproteobacteria bacterium]
MPEGDAKDSADRDGDGVATADDCDDDDANVGEASTYFFDGDQDGHGDPAASESACARPEGFSEAGDDCDDTDATVYPGAIDTCNNRDDDCSGAADDGVDSTAWYADTDGDSYGDASAETFACSAPAGSVADASDCDDADPNTHPGAAETDCTDPHDYNCDGSGGTSDADADGYPACTDCDDSDNTIRPDAREICNAADDDCDGLVDDDDANLDLGTAERVYADADGDGYGDASVQAQLCDPGPGWVTVTGDCDDAAAEVNPGATEVCNGWDDDCDGKVDDDDASRDEASATAWYADRDDDGYGADSTVIYACAPPADTVTTGGDCDDLDEAYNPGAAEADCTDLNDYNCDGSVAWTDGDGDAYTACEDCDDADADVSPAALEVCDGIDNDCDAETDEGDALDADTWYADLDGDSYGDPGAASSACSQPADSVADATDCDDSDAIVHPGAVERCDGVDDDCNGEIDEDSSADADLWYLDADLDGYGDAAVSTRSCSLPSGYSSDNTDCDDSDSNVSPGALETCNGIDDDCDSEVDESTALDAGTWYVDGDGDGYGDATIAVIECDMPPGYVADDTDCDDTDAIVNPAAVERCDGVDDDCDGSIDPSTSVDADIWYADADGDGYGYNASTLSACTQPSGYVSVGGDCNDASTAVSPAETEVCNSIDDDCDGTTDESDATDALTWYLDADGDGYGDIGLTAPGCTQPSGYVADDSDCEDSDSSAYPGSTHTETPGDGIDTDCDGEDACTDLNCDGIPDLAMAGYYDGDYTVDSYATYGSGFASASRTTLTNTGSYRVKAGDIDEDGYQDLLFVNHYSGSTYVTNSYVYWGSASGYSSSDRTSLATLGALDALVQDLDDDGYNDIVFANYSSATTSNTDSYIYWGSASGWSSSDRTSIATNGARTLTSADFDDDGYPDLVFCNYYSTSGTTYSTNSYVYWGSSSGYSASDRTSFATKGCFDTDTGDVNGDGWTDLAFANYYDGSAYTLTSTVFYGAAAGFSPASKASLPTKGSIGVEIADTDNDGYDDVIYPGYFAGAWATTAATYVYKGASTGLSSSSYTSLVTTCGVRDPQVADLNGDGYLDMVFPRHYAPSSYSTDSYVYWGAAAGFTDTNRTSLPTVGATEATIGDLDQDGYPDLLFASYYNGTTYSLSQYIYWGSATGYSSSDLTTVGGTGVVGPVRMVGDVEW